MITVADIPNINENVKPLDIKDFIESTENKYPEIDVVKFLVKILENSTLFQAE